MRKAYIIARCALAVAGCLVFLIMAVDFIQKGEIEVRGARDPTSRASGAILVLRSGQSGDVAHQRGRRGDHFMDHFDEVTLLFKAASSKARKREGSPARYRLPVPRAEPARRITSSSAYSADNAHSKSDISVLQRGKWLEIMADVDEAGLANPREILNKYEEILKLVE